MGDAPPPRRAPLGRPTLITDLPTDVLSYIISIIPEEYYRFVRLPYARLDWRVRLSVVCRAFADAVRPPSEVWVDVYIDFLGRGAGSGNDPGLREHRNTPSQQGAYGTLERAMQVAGPCVRRLAFVATYGDDNNLVRAWVERVLAATPRVHYLEVQDEIVVEGPPPMISAGRAAILDFWTNYRSEHVSQKKYKWGYLDAVLALHRNLVAVGRQAGVAARTVPVLTSVGSLNMSWRSSPPVSPEMDVQRLLPFIRSLTADVGAHLTRLQLPSGRESGLPLGVPAFVDRLPALRELHVCGHLDLRSVVTPPRGLTCLGVHSWKSGTAHHPPAIMARLEVMDLIGQHAPEPPDCLRDAGSSFSRLTRLVYGAKDNYAVDLAGWATPAVAVPTLVALEVDAQCFTLGATDGPAWAATVASTTLPRLERLWLFPLFSLRQRVEHTSPLKKFVQEWVPNFRGNSLMPADAVAEAITHSLPAAAAAAGRSLSVRVQAWNSAGRVGQVDLKKINKGPVDLQKKRRSDYLFLTLKYEARPVR